MTGQTVVEGGRSKAYRPLSVADRRAAFAAGLAAYDRGDWFLAHELLEPAWMGSPDPAERALHGGLIKLAAAGVHATRRNPPGIVKNLTGARTRLAILVDGPASARGSRNPVTIEAIPGAARLDLVALAAAIDARLAAEARAPSTAEPPAIPRRRP